MGGRDVQGAVRASRYRREWRGAVRTRHRKCRAPHCHGAASGSSASARIRHPRSRSIWRRYRNAERLLQHRETGRHSGLRGANRPPAARRCRDRPRRISATTFCRSKRGLRPIAPWMFHVITRTRASPLAAQEALPYFDTAACRPATIAIQTAMQHDDDDDVRGTGRREQPHDLAAKKRHDDKPRKQSERGADDVMPEPYAARAGNQIDQRERSDRHQSHGDNRDQPLPCDLAADALSACYPARLPGRRGRPLPRSHK